MIPCFDCTNPSNLGMTNTTNKNSKAYNRPKNRNTQATSRWEGYAPKEHWEWAKGSIPDWPANYSNQVLSIQRSTSKTAMGSGMQGLLRFTAI